LYDQFASVGHCLEGVFHKVDECRLQRAAVETDVREVGIELSFQTNIELVGLGLV
jgi:hypothetical protein